MGTWTEGAKAALSVARAWDEKGIKNITVINPNGQSYGLDRFARIASTKPGKDK
jgi:hypothetical protein